MSSDLSIKNEEELRLQLMQGSEEAFTRIVHHYYPRLFPFAMKITKTKHTAEEIVQEVFLRLWQKRKDMERTGHLGPWLFRVASNLSLTWLKRAAFEGNILLQIKPSSSNSVEEYLDLRQTEEWLNAAVDKLPEQQKKIFRLSKEEGLNNQEIAERLQLSVNTVKNHLTRALQTLREGMGPSGMLFLCIYLFQESAS